jgi:hypothetical protein
VSDCSSEVLPITYKTGWADPSRCSGRIQRRLLIDHVDVTAGVDEYILGLGHKLARQWAGTLARLRRNKPPLSTGSSGDFRVKMWATSSPGDKLTSAR